MTPTPHSRRDVLKGAAAIAAAASVGTTSARRATAQGSAKAQIDGVLRQAVDAKEVPGVVAMAATDKGLLYEGAFGLRALDQSTPMTLDTVFRIASMTKAITPWRRCSSSSRASSRSRSRAEIDPGRLHPGAGGFDARAAPSYGPQSGRSRAPLLTHTAGQLRRLGREHGAATSRPRGCPRGPPASWPHPHAARLRSRGQGEYGINNRTGRVASSRCSAASRSTSTSGTRSSRRSA